MKIFQPILSGATLRDRAVACLGAFLGIALTALASRWLLGVDIPTILMMSASMGASSVLLFVVPASPMVSPWALVGGHTVSALVGIAVARVVPDMALACGLAAALAIALMSLMRCLHPPGGSTALIAVLAGPTVAEQGWLFAFDPVALNAALLAAAGYVFHRFSGHAWPHRAPVTPEPVRRIEEADIDAALDAFGEPLDISRADLKAFIDLVENQRAARAARVAPAARPGRRT